MENVQGKVIVITGASSGIGEATARYLAKYGAKVVVGARREDRLRSLALAIGGHYAVTDVTDRASVEGLVALAQREHGRVDVMINNAGIAPISRVDELRVEDWQAMIDVNVRGTLHGIAAAMPLFRAQKSGHFVNVVSTAGLQISPLMAIYAATKNAVRTLSEGLRKETKELRVTVVSPGFVRTNLASTMQSETRAQIEKGMAEMGLPPEAVARAIAFAIDAPAEVEIGDLVIRPTAQT